MRLLALTILTLFDLFTSSDVNLVIHLIPHSHVDAGWLDTIESNFDSNVAQILSKVVDLLDGDTNRRFVWAEVFYFKKWYENLSQSEKERCKKLVQEGRLEFVNGGMVEHDEASNRVEDILFQMSLGHGWLEKHFGVKPKIGWQIGNAGHSEVSPTIYSAMNFEGLVIDNIHFQLLQQFKSEKHLEFVWGNLDAIFTHVLDSGFEAPIGFDFESSNGVRPVTNAKRRAERLIHIMRERASNFRTHNILVPFGGVSRFIEADKQFTNMEKLMRHINEKMPDISIRFSSASEYFTAVRETAAVTGLTFPKYTGDFYPYADDKQSYWTGSYSSRMALKDASRNILTLVNSAQLFFSFARARVDAFGADVPYIKSIVNGLVETDPLSVPDFSKYLFEKLQSAQAAASLMTHHHAIAGTSSATVVSDYLSLIHNAENDANLVLHSSMSQLLTKRPALFNAAGPRIQPMLTTTSFNIVAELLQDTEKVDHPVIIFNAHSISKPKVIRIYVGTVWEKVSHIQVVDDHGNSIRAQLCHQIIGGRKKDDPWTTKIYLTFVASVPPMAFRTYFVFLTSARERIKQSQMVTASTPITHVLNTGTTEVSDNGIEILDNAASKQLNGIKIENDALIVEVDITTGLLKSIQDKATQRTTLVKEKFFRYAGSGNTGVHVLQSSASPTEIDFNSQVLIAWTRGPLFDQIQTTGNGIAQIIRVWKGEPELEGFVETVMLVNSELNADIAVRFETNMNTEEVFYTDNALGDLVKRNNGAEVQRYTYPAVSTVALRDASRLGQVLGIIAKTPFGASSPVIDSGNGCLQITLHRNHETNDKKGMNEPMNDFSTTHFSALLVVRPQNAFMEELPKLIDFVQNPAQPLFAHETPLLQQILTRSNWASRFNTRLSLLKDGVSNIITSLSPRDAFSNQVVVQMRNRSPNKVSEFNFNQMFDSENKVDGFQKCSANGLVYEKSSIKLRTTLSTHGGVEYLAKPEIPVKESEYHLAPGEIQTFIVSFSVLQDEQLSSSMYDIQQKDDPPTAAPENRIRVPSVSSIEKTVVISSHPSKDELESSATRHREKASAMERRIRMYNSNIDALLAEVSEFESQNKLDLRDAALHDLKLAEASLQQATVSLQYSREQLQQVALQLQTFYGLTIGPELGHRETEAAVHGAVAGAGAMLLLIVAANWIRSGLKMKKGYVPISWALNNSDASLLPTSKSH